MPGPQPSGQHSAGHPQLSSCPLSQVQSRYICTCSPTEPSAPRAETQARPPRRSARTGPWACLLQRAGSRLPLSLRQGRSGRCSWPCVRVTQHHPGTVGMPESLVQTRQMPVAPTSAVSRPPFIPSPPPVILMLQKVICCEVPSILSFHISSPFSKGADRPREVRRCIH